MTLSSLDEPAMRGPYSLMIPHRQRWQKKKKKKMGEVEGVPSSKIKQAVTASCLQLPPRRLPRTLSQAKNPVGPLLRSEAWLAMAAVDSSCRCF